MSYSDTRNHIVQALASGAFCSGEELGNQLGISRAGIAKHIKALQELGLDIFSVTGKGYKLASPISLYNKKRMLSELDTYGDQKLHVEHVIGSTNDHLKYIYQSENGLAEKGTVCLAEAQTAGRGRQGKKWVSPFGSSLYLSMYWPFAGGYQSISGLSLAVGVAVARTVQSFGNKNIALKWPNDVYSNGKKLAGVLIDVDGQLHGACHCIIGIGINVALPGNVSEIDQPFIDLNSMLPAMPDKNLLAVALIRELNKVLTAFEVTGLKPFVDEWNSLDIYPNQPVKLITGSTDIKGVAKGIDESGALQLEIKDPEGRTVLRSFYGGEVSVRPDS